MNKLTLEEYTNTINDAEIPDGLSVQLQSLWYDKIGNWTKAHDLIDNFKDKSSAHIHAYLHRKEGDIWNADYWYSQAGKTRPDITLDEEWANLAQLMLSNFG